MKKELKDIAIQKLKPDKAGPYEVMDSVIKGFGIRVHPSGSKSFILFKRFPGSPNPVRRTIGHYRELVDGDDGKPVELTLALAREKAFEWNRLLKKGKDPQKEEERQHLDEIEAEKKRQEHTFGAVLDAYLRHKAADLRSIAVIEATIRREFSGWMSRPLTDITQDDVKRQIKRIVNRGAKTSAHNALCFIRAFFNWCLDTGDYGLSVSPVTGLKPGVIIGEKNVRTRTLDDCELAAFWWATETMGYPMGRLFQLLVLTAVRRDEAGDAKWSEFDMNAKLWVIPAERMKGKKGKVDPHAVPLTDAIIDLLKGLTRFHDSDYLFSFTGRKPVRCYGLAKLSLDGLMRADLEAQGKTFEPFVLQDLRRTCRTRFSALPDVEDVVCEALLAHVQPGIRKTYNLYKYEPEKRRALELWHKKLESIVIPPDNKMLSL
ncbi:MAG: integrase arm-type DNA-binding domain-containing protein [Rhodomicrobium sp.]